MTITNATGRLVSKPEAQPSSYIPTCRASRHGTRAAYVAGCRCPEARQANTDYARNRERRTAHAAFGAAPPFTVPANDTRSVIEQLRGIGWTLRRIEAETGIGRDHLARIDGRTCRPLRRVRWHTHQRVVALLDREPVVAPNRLVDAFPTWQRIEGLIALGYPKVWIARQIGNDRALQVGRYLVAARTAEKIRTLADAYGTTAGPSNRARTYAAARGWTPDLIWQADDDYGRTPDDTRDIDDVAVDRATIGIETPLTRAERLEAVRVMHARGDTYSRIAERLHVAPRQVHRDLADLGLTAGAA